MWANLHFKKKSAGREWTMGVKVRTDVSACDCTQGCLDTKRACTESWLREKALLHYITIIIVEYMPISWHYWIYAHEITRSRDLKKEKFTHKMHMMIIITTRSAICGMSLNDVIFMDTITVISIRLCVMLVQVELPCSYRLQWSLFEDCRGVKWLKLKVSWDDIVGLMWY